MTASQPKPFPWHGLTKVSRQASAGRLALRQWVAGGPDEAIGLLALENACEEVLGSRLQFSAPWLGPSFHASRPKAFRDGRLAGVAGVDDVEGASVAGIGVTLLVRRADGAERRMRVEVEQALASELVHRALKQPPSLHPDPMAPLSPRVAGAVGAIVAAVLRRVPGLGPPKVLHCGPTDPDGRPAKGDLDETFGQDEGFFPFTVRSAGGVFAGRLRFPLGRPGDALDGPLTPQALTRLGATPLALPVVLDQSLASPADLADLDCGDIWFPAPWAGRIIGNRLVGRVFFAGARSERGITGALTEKHELLYLGDPAPLPWVFRPDLLETLMNDESKPRNAKDPAPSPPPADTTAMARPRAEGLAETLGDVPLVVRVEVGSVELPAKQWASLGVGDAVGLGRRLGDRATLRVSGVAVARGELVDLDGELGVRILERLAP